MFIDSVEEVAVKEIVVSIVDYSVSSILCSFLESIVVKLSGLLLIRLSVSVALLAAGLTSQTSQPTSFLLQTDLSFFELT